jgi:hypothetical protein
MRTVLQRRPSASMVISLLALVVAMSGTAVAATSLVNGDKLIRRGTLSGNRLRKHTLTGTQINLKKLGTVPSAQSANTAGSAGYASHAGSADTATSATNATHAASASSADNAASLGGRPASSFLTTGSRVGTNGIARVGDASGPGAEVTLFSQGPFTVTMTCTRASNGDTSLKISVTSSESNSDLDGDLNQPPNSPLDLFNISATSVPSESSNVPLSLEAPSGAEVVMVGSYGVDSLNVTNGCWANFAGIA